jgi:hypothetical protein
MKVLLQQKNTGEYYKEDGVWTRDPAEAMDFLSSTKAIEYCVTRKVAGVHLVLKFEEQHYDIVLPVVTEGRYHGSRFARAG